MVRSNDPVIQLLREHGPLRSFGWDDDDLVTLASLGILDGEASTARITAVETAVADKYAEIDRLEEQIAGLRREIDALEKPPKLLLTPGVDPLLNAPGNLGIAIRLLAEFVRETRSTLADIRRFVLRETGIAYYQVIFFDRFVLAGFMGVFEPEWLDSSVWADHCGDFALNSSFVNRAQSHYPGQFDRATWQEILTAVKHELTPHRVHALVTSICEREQCSLPDLLELRRRLCALTDRFPEDYRISELPSPSEAETNEAPQA